MTFYQIIRFFNMHFLPRVKWSMHTKKTIQALALLLKLGLLRRYFSFCSNLIHKSRIPQKNGQFFFFLNKKNIKLQRLIMKKFKPEKLDQRVDTSNSLRGGWALSLSLHKLSSIASQINKKADQQKVSKAWKIAGKNINDPWFGFRENRGKEMKVGISQQVWIWIRVRVARFQIPFLNSQEITIQPKNIKTCKIRKRIERNLGGLATNVKRHLRFVLLMWQTSAILHHKTTLKCAIIHHKLVKISYQPQNLTSFSL